MGKHSTESKYEGAKILFKKSNTIFTHSRTCSGISQFYTKSGILQIKNNLCQSQEYYTKGNKVKRDLSIETDICILRRYYKSKKNRMSNPDGSAKSKYSTVVDTEIDTIEEFKPDTSACGDSEHTENYSNENKNLNISALMVDNLKLLMNRWIEKHLLENEDTKEKIETVLDSILHKMELNRSERVSSRSTYILNKDGRSYEVKNKQIETASITCQYCKHKSRPVIVNSSSNVTYKELSCQSAPFAIKKLRIVSTLSIPKSKNKMRSRTSSWYKVKKIKHKNIMLSINRSSKLLANYSSFDLLAISTESLTKRFATYDTKNNRKRRIVFYPKPFYKSVSNTTEMEKIENFQYKNEECIQGNTLETMPSLVKSIFADDPANVTSTEKDMDMVQNNDNFTLANIHNLRHNIVSNSGNPMSDVDTNCTYNSKNAILNEKDQSEPLITIDFIDQSLEFPNMIEPKKNAFINKYYFKSKSNGYRKKTNLIRKRKNNNNVAKFQKIHNSNFTFLYKKVNEQSLKSEQFLKHLKSILQFFAEHKDNKNINLDIQINVFPNCDKSTKNECTNVSNDSINDKDIAVSTMAIYNVAPTTETPTEEGFVKENTNFGSIYNQNIIPLLDGSASQANYIFTSRSATTKSIASKCKVDNVDHATITSDLQIAKEIHELKSVIKELAVAAEKYVNEQIRKEYIKAQKVHCKVETVENPKLTRKNPSKGIQISNDFAKNVAGLKLSKEPKKDALEFFNRLTKRSTSYNVIESESILKVTDMTVVNENNYQKFSDKALTCSLPKSRSLFEITTERKKRKVITYFCDSCKKEEFCGGCRSLTSNEKCPSRSISKSKNSNVDSAGQPSYCGCSQNGNNNLSYPKGSEYSSTTFIDNDKDICCDSTKLLDRGMGFGEGLIYCVLLWIPVIIITILFYRFVIKDMIHTGPTMGMLREGSSTGRKNEITSNRLSNKMNVHKSKGEIKRTNSGTCFPNNLPTYVVAFAMQDTYDDLMTAQQMICNKRSPEGSINSITPSNSLRILDNTAAEKPSHIINIPEDITQTKTEITNNHSDVNMSHEIYNDFLVNNKTVDEVHEQPEIIFNAPKYNRRCKETSNKFTRKKPKKYKHVGKFANTHFKYKNPKNTITRKIENYCKKAKRNAKNSVQIQKGFCSNLSNLVSHCRILKKVLARENLLEQRTSFFDEINLSENDCDSIISLPSTNKKKSTSNSSGNTLTREGSSSSSRNDDFYSISAVNSVIHVSSDTVIPYKTDVLSVAVTVAYNTTNVNTTRTRVVCSKNKLLLEEDCTSTATIVLPTVALTSQTLTEANEPNTTTEEYMNDYDLNINYTSDETLIGAHSKSCFEISSDDDSFFIARTSSDFNQSNAISDFTLTSNSENKLHSQNIRPTLDEKDVYNRARLLDTVINLGMYPEMTPSNSSTINFNENYDEVLITNELKTFPLTPQSKGDQHSRDIKKELSKNILMKSIEMERKIGAQKTFNLPNEAIIKAKLEENEKSQRESCTEEFSHEPSNFSEMWDKLILILDLAVKRLEKSLSEKILREIKKSFAVFEQYKLPIPKIDVPNTNNPLALEMKSDKVMSNEKVSVERERIKIGADSYMQCDLVDNQIIDQLMMKLSLKRPKFDVRTSTKSIDKYKTKSIRDYFEVLKPPAIVSPADLMKGDTVTVSTTIPELIEEIHRFHRLKVLFTAPANFVKENLLIVTSVPTFFVILLCIYGLIVLVMKPW